MNKSAIKWTKVFAHASEQRIEIVKYPLDENELNPVVINKKISGYGLGDYEIHVPSDNVIKALKVIKDLGFE